MFGDVGRCFGLNTRVQSFEASYTTIASKNKNSFLLMRYQITWELTGGIKKL